MALKAGVRQGGILSPTLFALYVDEILVKLERSHLGCRIRGLFLGAFMYADDLLLAAISLSDLQEMIRICQIELENIEMLVNADKTMCLRVGSQFAVNCVSLQLNQMPLKWAQTIRYLGIYFLASKSFKICMDEARKKFFISSNSILSKVGTEQVGVVLSLINSFCVPILTYALESVHLCKSERVRLDNPYTMVFHKLFGTYSKSIIQDCQKFCGYLPLSYFVDLKTLRFLRKMSDVHLVNNVVHHLFEYFGRIDFWNIAARYNINLTDSNELLKRKVWTAFVNSIVPS